MKNDRVAAKNKEESQRRTKDRGVRA